jgi:CheY-like chemotaxis protein
MKPAILVVDDDKKTVDLIRLYLEKDGYRVLVAYDGRGAIDIARNRRPGLIILDLMLPKVDGLDECRLLRRPEGYPSGIDYNHLGYSVFLHAQENTLKPFGTGKNGGNEHFPLRSMT